MLASVNARNYGAYYRTRAAVLCFGGWGLQTMLHLWPRLRLIQEERQILGIDRELPNLDRLTAFAAILPKTAPASGTLPVPPFHVLQPNPERYPAPFYLERQLASIEAEAVEASLSGLTHAERVGARLLKRVRDDGYVRPLPVTFRQPAGSPLTTGQASGRPRVPTRFGPASRRRDRSCAALLSQVIDPTRLDSMQTRDPFVQTTIYVIAPLSEPLASALVWPVVSELVGALKRRHVSRVIAFFSTASFAPDDGRAIEEATAHMSRRELEALTGSAGQDDRPDLLSRLIADCGGAAWQERVGRRLFDVVHLIDREKSNQALAESALDLSVLTGNAVEAFLTADGLGHLERSLGPETVTGRPSYSVLGAASDHVPLAEYIASAIEEEQKGVIRSAVLAAGDRPVTVEADLQALGATPDAFVRRFLDAGGTPMFKLATDRPSPAWPPGVRIADGYLLPKAVASDLRETKDPMRWRERLEFRAAEVAAEVKRVYGAAQVAWGLSPDKLDGGERELPSALGGDLEPTDIAISRVNARVIQKAADLAAEQIVADMCSAPDGILRARARLSGWLGAVGALLHDLQQETDATDTNGEAYQTRLDAWQWAFTSAAASHPQTVTLWVRILVVACLSSLGLAGIMLLQRSFDLGREDRIALVVGLVGALALLGAAAWLATSGRMRRLKQQRIALAQEDLSGLATRLLRRGLCRAYSQLAGELTGLQAAVEDALVDLSDWARAEPEPQKAASDAGDAPTRAAVTNVELWESVRDQVRRESADGEHGLERFRELWHKDGSDSPQWLPEGNRLARRLRTALDERRQAHGDAPSTGQKYGPFYSRGFQGVCRAGHGIPLPNASPVCGSPGPGAEGHRPVRRGAAAVVGPEA